MLAVSCVRMVFSKKLKRLMAEWGYSQGDVAVVAQVSQRLVSNWVRGEGGGPGLQAAFRMAEHFGVPLVYLADDRMDENPDAEAEDERTLLRHFRVLKRNRGIDVDEAMAWLDKWIPASDISGNGRKSVSGAPVTNPEGKAG